MHRMKPPKVPDRPVPIIPEDALVHLLKTCEGTGFVERRDGAIMRVMLDTGARLAEVTGLRLADVDLATGTLTVTRKGGAVQQVWLGTKTVRAVDRYFRARAAPSCGRGPTLARQAGVHDRLRRRQGSQAALS
jgi:integrase/recombinase XerC